MAKDNIYDLTISELILRVAAITAANLGAPALIITNSSNSNELPENYNGTLTFTSTVVNLPSGYYVNGVTHVISYPLDPDTTGSTTSLTGAGVTVILGALGTTFVVTSAVTLSHATDPDIILAGTQTITSVLPIFYGIEADNGLTVPSVPSLFGQIADSDLQFTMTTSVVGRMYIGIPISNAALISVSGPSGLVYTVASDFDTTVVGSLTWYHLQYDTQLTGTNIKTFTLNY